MSERCCMFRGERKWEDAIADLEYVESLFFEYRRSFALLRCKKCGALVLREYEEQNYYTPDENWDDAYCYDRYYPVESAEEAGTLAEKYYSGWLNTKRDHLEVFYRELSSNDKYYSLVTV